MAYWDLEQFSQVGVSPVESNGVRCVLFHPDEEILFSASQDSLRVYADVVVLTCVIFLSLGALLGASLSTRLPSHLMGKD